MLADSIKSWPGYLIVSSNSVNFLTRPATAVHVKDIVRGGALKVSPENEQRRYEFEYYMRDLAVGKSVNAATWLAHDATHLRYLYEIFDFNALDRLLFGVFGRPGHAP